MIKWAAGTACPAYLYTASLCGCVMLAVMKHAGNWHCSSRSERALALDDDFTNMTTCMDNRKRAVQWLCSLINDCSTDQHIR